MAKKLINCDEALTPSQRSEVIKTMLLKSSIIRMELELKERYAKLLELGVTHAEDVEGNRLTLVAATLDQKVEDYKATVLALIEDGVITPRQVKLRKKKGVAEHYTFLPKREGKDHEN